MKVILLLITITLFPSCDDDQPTSFEGTQCSPVFAYEDIAGKQYISIENSVCNCRGYKVSQEYMGVTIRSVAMPIANCDKINGYSPKEYTLLANLMNLVRDEINDNQSFNKEIR